MQVHTYFGGGVHSQEFGRLPPTEGVDLVFGTCPYIGDVSIFVGGTPDAEGKAPNSRGVFLSQSAPHPGGHTESFECEQNTLIFLSVLAPSPGMVRKGVIRMGPEHFAPIFVRITNRF